MIAIQQNKITKGRDGERIAQSWLVARGFRIIRQNWRSPRKWQAGEVDILAERLPLEIWLIEVKYHRAQGFSLLTAQQLKRLKRAAILLRSEMPGFDVKIALLWVETDSKRVEWLENPEF